MKKILSFYLPRFAIVLALSVALSAAGIFALSDVSEAASGIFAITAIVCLVLLIFCYIASPIAAKKFKAKLNFGNVKEGQERMLALAETIRADYMKAKKSLVRLRRGVTVYVILVCLMSAYCIFVSSYLSDIKLLVAAMFVLLGVAFRIRPFARRNAFDGYADPKDYPALHALAKKAAEASGVRGDIRIVFTPEGFAGIARIGKTLSLQLNTVMLAVMREEELYTVLLHEMAHVKNTDTDIAHDNSLISFLTDDDDGNVLGMTSLLFAYPTVLFGYRAYTYRMLASVVVEETADRAMAAIGNKQDAANALFKIECLGIFTDKTDYYMDERLYEPEECIPNIYGTIAASFLSKMRIYEDFWRGIMQKEIQPRSATHPILRARLETIGTHDVRLTEPEAGGAYRDECQKALDELDQKIYEAMAEHYAEKREEYYLKPLAIFEEWESVGHTYTVEEARKITDALINLMMKERAIEFCTELIEKEKGGIVNYAKFKRGSLLLERYDNAGLADIYDAMDENTNYIESGLEIIGQYCCQMGLQKELEEYRARAVTYAQKDVDTEGLSSLSASDTISEEDKIPQELFERNLEYIKRVGGEALLGVYLVRKKITEEMDSSVYILEFRPESDYETVSAAMDKVFELLDNCPEDWQYSLFLLDDNIKKVIAKLPSCCIYKADK